MTQPEEAPPGNGGPPGRRGARKAGSDTAYLKLQDRIGYAFQDPRLLQQALTHPSSTVEDGCDNERMEFLGDGVLNLCIAQYFYEQHPDWSEGLLTQAKSALVSTVTLARAAGALGLRELGRLGKGLPADEPLPKSVSANLFEAVCGAVYLDGGMEAAHAFIRRSLDSEIELVSQNGQAANYKSQLQQMAQRDMGLTPHYRVVRTMGPDHGKLFEIVAQIGLRSFPPGVGRSKKEAEQAAARRALEALAEIALAARSSAAGV